MTYKVSLLLSHVPPLHAQYSAPATLTPSLFLDFVKHTPLPEHLLFPLPDTLLHLISAWFALLHPSQLCKDTLPVRPPPHTPDYTYSAYSFPQHLPYAGLLTCFLCLYPLPLVRKFQEAKFGVLVTTVCSELERTWHLLFSLINTCWRNMKMLWKLWSIKYMRCGIVIIYMGRSKKALKTKSPVHFSPQCILFAVWQGDSPSISYRLDTAKFDYVTLEVIFKIFNNLLCTNPSE